VAERLVAQFSSEMSGIGEMRGVTVIGTVLDPESLDPRVRGVGRFEVQVGLPDPDQAERLEILQVLTRNKPVSGRVDLGAIAKKTQGLNGAELENLCRMAAEETLKEQLQGSRKETLVEVGPDHFEKAIRKIAGESV